MFSQLFTTKASKRPRRSHHLHVAHSSRGPSLFAFRSCNPALVLTPPIVSPSPMPVYQQEDATVHAITSKPICFTSGELG